MKHINLFEDWKSVENRFIKNLFEDSKSEQEKPRVSRRTRKDASWYHQHGGKPGLPNFEEKNTSVIEKFEDLCTYCEMVNVVKGGIPESQAANIIFNEMKAFNTDEAKLIDTFKNKSVTRQGFANIINKINDLIATDKGKVGSNISYRNFEEGIKSCLNDSEIQKLLDIYKSLK